MAGERPDHPYARLGARARRGARLVPGGGRRPAARGRRPAQPAAADRGRGRPAHRAGARGDRGGATSTAPPGSRWPALHALTRLLPGAPGRQPAARRPGPPRRGAAAHAVVVGPPGLDRRRRARARPRAGRSRRARARLADELRPMLEPGETVRLPRGARPRRAAGGMGRPARSASGAPVVEMPTIPPSVPGHAAGGRAGGGRAGGRRPSWCWAPDAVGVGGRPRPGDGGAGAPGGPHAGPLPADAVVLATGGFASGGIELDSHGAPPRDGRRAPGGRPAGAATRACRRALARPPAADARRPGRRRRDAAPRPGRRAAVVEPPRRRRAGGRRRAVAREERARASPSPAGYRAATAIIEER